MQQIVQSVRDVHLLLTPLTYAQYIARSNQPGSTLAPIDQFHGSRPSNAHCKELKNICDCTDDLHACVVIIIIKLLWCGFPFCR